MANKIDLERTVPPVPPVKLTKETINEITTCETVTIMDTTLKMTFFEAVKPAINKTATTI